MDLIIAGEELSSITQIDGNIFTLPAVVGISEIRFRERKIDDKDIEKADSDYYFEIMLLGGHFIPFSDSSREVLEELRALAETDLRMYYAGGFSG